MATLILGTVGRALGGPIGGIVGTVLGGFVDRAVLGSGPGRQGPRLSNLAVQSAAYGEPIPHVHGRLRLAGNLVWTDGIRESMSRSGGGKRGGPVTTNYSYSASFAVLLSGRRVASVGRIWADGKLLRDAAGVWTTPVTMRLHDGGGGQSVDPLIAAAEPDGTPAYRGRAYAVFEDLPLADYGNRLPNLTFEVIADADAIDAGEAMAALALSAGVEVAVTGGFPALTGHVAAGAGSLASALEPLLALADARVASGAGLALVGVTTAVDLPAGDADAHVFGTATPPEQRRRDAADTLPDAWAIGYFDPARDYQSGLQRAVRGVVSGRTAHHDLPVAMEAGAAKAMAEAGLARASAARHRRAVRLPWRHLGFVAGDLVAFEGRNWRVRERRFENFVATLELEAVDAGEVVAATADSGRALAFDTTAAGPTTLHVFELPPLTGALPQVPQLWVAAAGGAGWRRAAVEWSGDGGASYTPAGTVEGGMVIGTAIGALPDGPRDRWDRHGSVEVELLSDAMWIEGRSEASVLAGANLALIGGELVQFTDAVATAPRRFRLSGLLRGRRDSEVAISGHAAGERFVLIEQDRMLRIDLPVETIGGGVIVRAAGVGDVAPVAATAVIAGTALRPLAPAALALAADGGDVIARWTRRSRAGFGWIDFADAPLGEEGEAYRVDVALDGIAVRSATIATPAFTYTAAMRAADGGGGLCAMTVAQISAATGPGATVSAAI